MDINTIQSLSGINNIYNGTEGSSKISDNNNATFETLFQSALSMINETNDFTNAVKEEEIKYALGYSENTHDLQAAQAKANMSLQYTIAVRNKLLEAYKEIINLQF